MKIQVINRLIIILFVNLLLLTMTVSGATPVPICTNPADQDYPSISGNTIVWQDYRNGNWDIYKWDPVNGEQPVTTDLANQQWPKISGDTIVWHDYRNGNWEVYKWDPVNSEQRVTTDPASQFVGGIFGDTIVWDDNRSGNSDIYKWDPVHGEQPVCTAPKTQYESTISGSTIVWTDWRTNVSIYKWDPINGEQLVVKGGNGPGISGDTIVWKDTRNCGPNWNPDIYKWDPVHGEQPVTTDPADQINPAISGNTIVWMDRRDGNWDIYKWDPVNGEQRVTSDPASQSYPSISVDTIVWMDNRNGNSDIYGINLPNFEPSFNITPSKIRITDIVEFNASQSVNVTQDIIFWDFGDGQTDSTGKSVITHSYTKPGNYTVNLTVYDSQGSASSTSQVVYVTIPVVLVHGWKSDTSNWNKMSNRLQQEGFEVWNFDYKSLNTADPRTIAPLLSTFIDTQRNNPSYNGQQYSGKVDIVCHSMGALVSRLYIENLDEGIHGKDIRQWIGIAPAHHGSALADYSIDNPFVAAIGYLFGGNALFQLQTESASVQALGHLSPTTKYRVIAGWNPTYSSNFGGGFLPATLAKRTSGSGPLYYWTHSGDMIVATAQSHDPAMGFDAYPIGGILGDSPAKEFDHIDICGSPRVIEAVVGYIEDVDKSSSNIVPTEDVIPHDYSLSGKVISGILGNTLQRIIVAVAVNAINSNSQATHATLQASSSSPESALITLLEWDDGDINMTLTSPSGIEYSADSLPSDIWYTKNGNSLNYIVKAPESGNWTTNLIPDVYPGHEINYNLTYYVRDISSSPVVIALPLPGFTNPPTDPDSDGLYEDLNANGFADWDDAVVLFWNTDWIQDNEPVTAFDFNHNGFIDWDDAVMLFWEV